MKSAQVFIQTKFFLFLPFLLAVFNISLASANTGSPGHEERSKGIKDSELQKTDYQIKTIVIDPGHGGHDPGCLGKNSREKHLALGVALKLAENIRRDHPGVRVILTRDSDVFIPLHERAAIANRNKADLFISIHCNFMPKLSYVRGSETYVMGLHTAEHNLDVAKRENASILLEDNYEKNYDYDPNSPEGHIMLSMFQNVFLEQSILFAEKVEAMIYSSANRKSRGVKQAGFVVLKETTMPSVLVETGFLSNADDEKFLLSEAGQQAMADAILKAFSAYKQEIETGVAAPAPPVAQAPPPPAPAPQATAVLAKNQEPAEQTTYDRLSILSNQSIRTAPAKEAPIQTPPRDPNDFQQPTFLKEQTETNTPAPKREPKIITLQGSRVDSDYGPADVLTKSADASHTQNIHFYIQLAASSKPLDLTEAKWVHAGYPIDVVIENNLYKYQVRAVRSFDQAQQARTVLQQKGFPDAFVVAYRFGQRLDMNQAKRELGME